ncbi:MAG: PAS domain S-box protein [Actinobacteria bacterium]|nr:PAS domain S-box protein [Actinomycetota bacterium]
MAQVGFDGFDGFDVRDAGTIFQSAATPMTVLARRPDGHVEVLAVNPAGVRVTGWDPVEVRGRTLGELYPEDHAARTERLLAELDRPGAVVDYRVEAEVATGRRAYEVHIIGLGARDDAFLALSMSRDITRREVAESALDETQALARIGHFSWNLETDELTWTDQMYELFGLPRTMAVVSADIFQTIDDPQQLRDRIDEAVATGGSYEAEFTFTRSDGERRRAMARGRALRGRDGTVVRIAGTTQDVTEQREAEAHAAAAAGARVRQAQALELNDDVLQGLATVRVALMEGDHDLALHVVDRTMDAARAIISDLLRDHLGTGPVPGDLVRARSTTREDGA